MNNNSTMLNEAIKLHNAGFKIIPTNNPQKSKSPLCEWGKYKQVQSKEDIIELFSKSHVGGIALITGSGIEVIDIDLKYSLDPMLFEKFKSKIKDKIGEDSFEDLVFTKTISNGYHLIYKTNIAEGNKKLASRYTLDSERNSQHDKVKVLFETRAEGGYILIPPSPGYKYYTKKTIEDIKLISDIKRNIIIDVCKSFNATNEIYKQIYSTPEDSGLRKSTVEEYIEKHTPIELLEPMGWQFKYQSKDNLYYVRPGKSIKEGHSASYCQKRKLFYVFTSSSIFQPNQAYNAFQVYSHLYHDGDYSKAAIQLYSDGYGDRFEKKETPPTKTKDLVPTNVFPVDVFPESVQEIIKETNKHLNYNIDFIGSSLLFACSICIGNSFRIRVKRGFIQNAVIYLVLVGRSSTTKSHALSFALKPIFDKHQIYAENYANEMTEYNRIQKLSKKEKTLIDASKMKEPVQKKLLVSDITLESLTEVHKHNKKGIGVYVDELAGWFKNFNRYNKGSDTETWLTAWSLKPIYSDRKSSPSVHIQYPFISVGGTIQEGVLHEIASKSNIYNGFVNRMLFVFPDGLKMPYWNETELEASTEQHWHEIITKLIDISDVFNIDNIPKELTYTEDAFNCLKDYQNELADQSNDPENIKICGLYAKIELYTIRLSLIMELLNTVSANSDINATVKFEKIGINSVQGAIKLAEYFKQNAIRVNYLIQNIDPINELPENKKQLYDSLNDNFTTKEGWLIADKLNFSNRTYKRFLKNKSLFKHIKHGKYKKIQ